MVTQLIDTLSDKPVFSWFNYQLYRYFLRSSWVKVSISSTEMFISTNYSGIEIFKP